MSRTDHPDTGAGWDLAQLLGPIEDDGQLVAQRFLPAREARHGELSRPLPASLAPWGEGLWSHQATAIDAARAGHDVVVATGTASGKSRCAQLPVAEAVLTGGTALEMFPTKALAHDQLRAVEALEVPGLVAACVDGDTSPELRSWARSRAQLVLTNPDTLHYRILPQHHRWASFFARLRYLVIDELHTMRGLFGSHTAHVVRRVMRVASHYGAEPVVLAASATVGEPARLMSQIVGRPARAVVDDGSPRAPVTLGLWDPPELADGRRASSHHETARVSAQLVEAGLRTIAFCSSRNATELVLADLSQRLDAHQRIRAYRGGYLAEERRSIETELADGHLDAVVATSALELGVDIGGLDAAVLDGFPGTLASFRQRIGRAGRRDRPSVAVLVAGHDQLDRWFLTHPDALVSRVAEPAVVNPSNPYVMLPQLACAAHELPLRPTDARWWGDEVDEGVRRLVLDDALEVRNGGASWVGGASPAGRIGLRGTGGDEFEICGPGGTVLGTADRARAIAQLHRGARYRHQGRAWQVTELDLGARRVQVRPDRRPLRVRTRSSTTVSILETERSTLIGRLPLSCGLVEVTEQVTGYQLLDPHSGAVVTSEPLELPPAELVTGAFWFTIDHSVLAEAGVGTERLSGALHAAEHALIGMLPLFAICDRWDIGGLSTPLLADTGAATIVIHEGTPGGAGVAELGFEAAAELLAATAEAIGACPCEQGCPSCVVSPKCGNANEPLDKRAARWLLRVGLGGGRSDQPGRPSAPGDQEAEPSESLSAASAA